MGRAHLRHAHVDEEDRPDGAVVELRKLSARVPKVLDEEAGCREEEEPGEAEARQVVYQRQPRDEERAAEGAAHVRRNRRRRRARDAVVEHVELRLAVCGRPEEEGVDDRRRTAHLAVAEGAHLGAISR